MIVTCYFSTPNLIYTLNLKAQALNLALTPFTYPTFKHKLSKIPKYQTD